MSRLDIRPRSSGSQTGMTAERNAAPPSRCKLITMKVVTYEAVVDGGEVKLPETVKLPEHAKVCVVVLGVEEVPPFTIHTPHLLRPEQAADFAMGIVEGEDAAVR